MYIKLHYKFVEKTNADMAESREELENQCSKLHGRLSR